MVYTLGNTARGTPTMLHTPQLLAILFGIVLIIALSRLLVSVYGNTALYLCGS